MQASMLSALAQPLAPRSNRIALRSETMAGLPRDVRACVPFPVPMPLLGLFPRVAGDAVADVIANRTGSVVTNIKGIGGSGWSSQKLYQAESGESYFVKTAQGRTAKEMFEGEALGLTALYDTHTLQVPKVIEFGDTPGGSFIVMEHLKFSGSVDQAELGRQLALMHKSEPKARIHNPGLQLACKTQQGWQLIAERSEVLRDAQVDKACDGCFGFSVNNTIGGTAQPNRWDSDWVSFFREQRLMHQVELTGNSQLKQLARPVADNLEVLFEGITVTPSILHGDLWSGNIAAVDGRPAIFDPAAYFGHSEAEFGMSWCAGFGRSFYDAYFKILPKQKGYEKRHALYTLYHYLNHYNLFGSGYLGECRRLLESLGSAVRA